MSLVRGNWYAQMPRGGAIYVGTERVWFALHWDITYTSLPRMRYIGIASGARCFRIPLWRHRGFCPHGYYKLNGALRLCDACMAPNPWDDPKDKIGTSKSWFA